MKRVVIRTHTEEKADGAVATETLRTEETSDSGLLEAWGFLVLIFFTFLLFVGSYRQVSSIVNQPNQENNSYGVQR